MITLSSQDLNILENVSGVFSRSMDLSTMTVTSLQRVFLDESDLAFSLHSLDNESPIFSYLMNQQIIWIMRPESRSKNASENTPEQYSLSHTIDILSIR